jgi:uncharacterized protein (DUF983 family)
VTETKHIEGQPGIAKAALLGLCPQCGTKSLFTNPVHFAERCEDCGLDYSAFNVGDGPAALLTLVIGALIIIMAILLDVAARPPFWVHVIIWVPLTVLMVVLSLRVAKGALLVSEYRNQAGEGQTKGEADNQ